MSEAPRERRKHPRAAARTGLRLRAGESDCVVLDISCSGVRFRSTEPPPLMTLLDVRLEIPRAEGDATDTLSCQGAVVRTEPVPDSDEQLVAVFVTHLGDDARLLLSDYVRRNAETTTSS